MSPNNTKSAVKPLKIGVLLSGSGTNLDAILNEIKNDNLNAQVLCVVSSNPNAYGITRAKDADIPVLIMEKNDYIDEQRADKKIVEFLQSANVDYVVMAGYMRKVTSVILNAYPNKVINLHPALLPAFVGAHAISDAYTAGVKVTGVTVHFANDRYDEGPIIAQRAIEVAEGESISSFEARIHDIEHSLLPEVIQMIAEDSVSIDSNGKVCITKKSLPDDDTN